MEVCLCIRARLLTHYRQFLTEINSRIKIYTHISALVNRFFFLVLGDKKYGYRNGIQTDLGDIRNDVWRDLVRELIVRSHEEDLFDKLLEWEKEHTYWLKTKAELEHYTLELYAARIFDNPKWVDYEAFAKHYGYQPQSYEG